MATRMQANPLNFNSKKVRLRRTLQTTKGISTVFQFQKGAIKTVAKNEKIIEFTTIF